MKNIKIVKNGFSIIELMIVVIIIGIVASSAIPSIEGIFQDRTQTVTRDMFVSAIQTAKREAIRRSRPTHICATADGDTCTTWGKVNAGWLVFVDENRDGELDDDDNIVVKQPVISSLAIKPCGASEGSLSKHLQFHSFGLTTATRLLINSNYGDNTKEDVYDRLIEINSTGRINHKFIKDESTGIINCASDSE